MISILFKLWLLIAVKDIEVLIILLMVKVIVIVIVVVLVIVITVLVKDYHQLLKNIKCLQKMTMNLYIMYLIKITM